MSYLQTYERPWDQGIVGVEAERVRPGVFVKHTSDGGFGIVIAMDDEQTTVMWSDEPSRYVFNPSDFKPRKGVMTRYGTSKLRPDYYGTVNVLDVSSGST